MKILAIVADKCEVEGMRRLCSQAGIEGDNVVIVHLFNGNMPEPKPSMKQLREMKATLDNGIVNAGYDYVFCAGETAARITLDTSTVNIGRLRGRSFDYVPGVRKPTKRKVQDKQIQDRDTGDSD